MDEDFKTPADVERALSSERAANALMRALRPAIQSQIGYALIPAARVRNCDPRQEIQDLVQDVFIILLKKNATALKSWDPMHGSSLEGFVRLIARRYVAGVLRSGKRNPFVFSWLPPEQLESQPDRGVRCIDEEIIIRDDLDSLLAKLLRKLSERGRQLFRLLYIEERSVADVSKILDITPAAIYTWRMRFRKLLRKLREEKS